MKDKDLRALIDKFFGGGTTLAEERRLYAYFSRGNVAEDLVKYRELFASFASLPEKQDVRPLRGLRRLIAGVAASVVLVVAGYAAWNFYEYRQLDARYAGSYVIVDGKRIDNLREIRPMIESALADARNIERTAAEQPQAADIEQELLERISDPEEYARIKELLN